MWNEDRISDRQLAREIGRRIGVNRQGQGWSRGMLAAMAGMSLRSIRFIERGRALPTVLSILKLSDALKMSPNEILGWKESTDGQNQG